VRELGFVIYDRHRWGALVKTVGKAPCTRKAPNFGGWALRFWGRGG
jgi:hypothetical protein